jgi:F-type H+-transporting ATPase subunit delta
MKDEQVICRRYSDALLSALKGKEKAIEAIQTQLLEFAEVLKGSEELKTILLNPVLSENAKKKILEDIGSKMKLEDVTVTFLKCLLDNGRLASLSRIAMVFEEISNQELGRETVTVTSSHPFSAKEQEEMKTKLEKLFQAKVFVTFKEEPELLGGFLIQAGHKIFDYSIKGHMEQLEHAVHKMRIR